MRLCIDLSLKFAPHLKDYNLVSWEARFPSTSGFFQFGLQPAWRILAVWGAKLLAHLQRIWCSVGIFCS
jgi:hypothetical protein